MNIEFRSFKGEWDWGYVQLHTGILKVEDMQGIVAVDMLTNTTVAICLADNITTTSAQCHIIVTDPMVLRHGLIEVCCDYVFNHMGLKAIYGWVPANNKKAVKLNKHMGWTVKTVFEGGYADNVDYLLMECKRADCQFIKQEKAA